MFNCAHIKRLTFSKCKFFKIVLAESGELVKLTFFADIGSHSLLMFKALVDGYLFQAYLICVPQVFPI